jgi:hypothetical protein
VSPELPDELEERRVIRLLAGAAETIPPLHDVEVETFVRLAAVPPGSRRASRRNYPRRPHLLTAAAAACVLAAVLPMRQPESSRPSTPSSGIAAHTVAFPEGSALSLLLSRPVEKHA